MTLAAGRELVENGLPSVDEWTVFGAGSTWTDQQWLAQLVFYGAERIGGLALATTVAVLLVVATFGLCFAAARWRGASARSTLVIALFFMQLARAPGIVRMAAIFGVVWATFLYLFAFSDYLTR